MTPQQFHAALPAWLRPRLPQDRRDWIAAAVVLGAVAMIVYDHASIVIWVLLQVVALAVPVGLFVAWRRRVVLDRAAALRAAGLSYSLEQIDAMSPAGFERAVRDLMIRDGVTARHVGQRGDQAADVKGTDGAGRVLVAQCKHTRTGGRVGVRVMYEVNGTAGPAHGADIAVVVTNGGFTRDARAFALRHGIYLLDREQLTRWADHGTSLQTLLGLREHAKAG